MKHFIPFMTQKIRFVAKERNNTKLYNSMLTLEKITRDIHIDNLELIVAGDKMSDEQPTGSGSWTISGPGGSFSDLHDLIRLW